MTLPIKTLFTRERSLTPVAKRLLATDVALGVLVLLGSGFVIATAVHAPFLHQLPFQKLQHTFVDLTHLGLEDSIGIALGSGALLILDISVAAKLAHDGKKGKAEEAEEIEENDTPEAEVPISAAPPAPPPAPPALPAADAPTPPAPPPAPRVYSSTTAPAGPAPAAPAAPPPPPTAAAAPAATGGGRGALLAAIRKGTELKKAEQPPQSFKRAGNGPLDAIVKAMEERRARVEGTQPDPVESDSDGDREWE